MDKSSIRARGRAYFKCLRCCHAYGLGMSWSTWFGNGVGESLEGLIFTKENVFGSMRSEFWVSRQFFGQLSRSKDGLSLRPLNVVFICKRISIYNLQPQYKCWPSFCRKPAPSEKHVSSQPGASLWPGTTRFSKSCTGINLLAHHHSQSRSPPPNSLFPHSSYFQNPPPVAVGTRQRLRVLRDGVPL